jgi:Rrf2 family protein
MEKIISTPCKNLNYFALKWHTMFSKSTEYALRAIIYLAQKSSIDHKIDISEFSKEIDSPKSFAARIFHKRRKWNTLVSSITGPTGGFYLSEQTKKKSVFHVLTLLEKDAIITGCILGLKECSQINPCPMPNQYEKIRSQLLEILDYKSILELSHEMKDTNVVIHNITRKLAVTSPQSPIVVGNYDSHSINYYLPTADYPLMTAHCPLPTAHCRLPTAR